jgi:DNA-binding NarL/FixJ family response regulator
MTIKQSPSVLSDTDQHRLFDAYLDSVKRAVHAAVDSVTLDGVIRRCEVCGTGMGIWPSGERGSTRAEKSAKRSDTKFCSTNCRSQDLRNRKNQAVQMDGAGFSLGDIAAELKSTPTTVQRWIETRKPK